MKCPVCKKKVDKKKQHKFTLVETRHDGVLGINRIQAGNKKYMSKRPMHNECAKTYRAAEKIMISAGLIKPELQFFKFDKDKDHKIKVLTPDGVIVGKNATFTVFDDIEAKATIGGKW